MYLKSFEPNTVAVFDQYTAFVIRIVLAKELNKNTIKKEKLIKEIKKLKEMERTKYIRAEINKRKDERRTLENHNEAIVKAITALNRAAEV